MKCSLLLALQNGVVTAAESHDDERLLMDFDEPDRSMNAVQCWSGPGYKQNLVSRKEYSVKELCKSGYEPSAGFEPDDKVVCGFIRSRNTLVYMHLKNPTTMDRHYKDLQICQEKCWSAPGYKQNLVKRKEYSVKELCKSGYELSPGFEPDHRMVCDSNINKIRYVHVKINSSTTYEEDQEICQKKCTPATGFKPDLAVVTWYSIGDVCDTGYEPRKRTDEVECYNGKWHLLRGGEDSEFTNTDESLTCIRENSCLRMTAVKHYHKINQTVLPSEFSFNDGQYAVECKHGNKRVNAQCHRGDVIFDVRCPRSKKAALGKCNIPDDIKSQNEWFNFEPGCFKIKRKARGTVYFFECQGYGYMQTFNVGQIFKNKSNGRFKVTKQCPEWVDPRA